MSWIRKIIRSLRPLYDIRALCLLLVCFGIGMMVDPAATLGLGGYLAYFLGMAGASLIISKVFMPYLSTREHVRSALKDQNIASALIVLARVFLMLGIMGFIMIWGK